MIETDSYIEVRVCVFLCYVNVCKIEEDILEVYIICVTVKTFLQ